MGDIYMTNSAEKRPKRSEIKKMIQEVFNNNPKKSFNYKQMSAAIGLNKKSGRQLVEVLLFEMMENGVLSEIAAGR
ncbi:MAG TPA: hypothetical protein DDW62_07770, partial [Marinilabiliaceae bacterium]|nr:hypothetical protein [Marinilabiliaceae bacterium]